MKFQIFVLNNNRNCEIALYCHYLAPVVQYFYIVLHRAPSHYYRVRILITYFTRATSKRSKRPSKFPESNERPKVELQPFML
jgi:hypothetical protein